MGFDSSVATFLTLLAALLVADAAFYRFASLTVKRRFHLAWQVGAFFLFLASLTLLRDDLYNPRLVIPVAILFTWVDIARIRFCNACGATLRSWLRRPCTKCAKRSSP